MTIATPESAARRRLLIRFGRWAGLSAAASLLAACQQAASPSPTAAPAAKPTTVPAAASSPNAAKPAASPAAAVSPAAKPSPSPAAAASPVAAQAKPSTAPTATGPLTQVKVGDLQISSGAGYYVAQEKGYLREAGLELDLQRFSTGGEQIPVLATGQLDVGVGAVSAALFNAFGRGIPIKVVADHGSSLPERSAGAIAIRKDLADSGAIKDWADLKGRSVAIAGADSSSEAQLVEALKKGNLTLNDVRMTVLSFPDMAAAFANKAIDASIYQEPFTTRGVDSGLVTRWKRADEIIPNQQVAVLMFSPAFAGQQDVAQRFVTAYLRGVRDYVDAFDKGVGKDAVVDILTKYTTIKERPLFDKMVPSGLKPDGSVNVESLRFDLDYYTRKGVVTGNIDMGQLVDTRFIQAAVQQLGPYQR